MVRFTVPIADILGNAYYHYELTSSNYNPTIDNTVTISVSVKSVFGNPIKDKSVTLYNNGVSVGTATTNNTGVATFSYTFSDWDTHIFTCNGVSLELQAKGWRTANNSSDLNVKYNKDTVMLKVSVSSLAFPTTWTLQNANVLGDVKNTIKPSMPVIAQNYSNPNTLIAVRDNGELWKRTLTSSQATASTYCLLTWHY